MKNLALPRIQALEPYSPPIDGRADYQEGKLLDFNEGTVPPAIDLSRLLENARPELYPEYLDLPARIGDYASVGAEQVMLTNGSDQAIDVIFRTFADVGDNVVIPQPSFSMFGKSALVAGNQIVGPQYEAGTLAFPTQAITEAIDDQTKLIAICNPNNPIGSLASQEDIEQIAEQASDAIVFVDEAYFEFSKQTAVPLIEEHPNVIVSRTFSKAFRLASLRIGYVLANQLYVNEMQKVRGPYDINQPASLAASAVLSQLTELSSYVDEVMGEAKPMVEEFFERSGIDFYPSAGNFVLFRPKNAADVAEALKQNGVLIRPQHKPPVEDTLRLTIGTVPQMQDFIETYATHII